MAQNKQKLWLKNNITYKIILFMLFYWILGNIILFSLFTVFTNKWEVISGFSLGFIGSFIGFLFLNLAAKWFFTKKSFKQVLAYFVFLIRMIIYGAIIILAIYFGFINLISIICGLSLLMVATLTSEFLLIVKIKKEKKKC